MLPGKELTLAITTFASTNDDAVSDPVILLSVSLDRNSEQAANPAASS